ncbi:hypothetical protein [Rhodovulum marinum]|uniref:Uncharacterized protein n=1 Tax=Rhodovulum marinum TaxID=320662 RepID=A0A4R2Q3P5_9RHOB|nr:hypothetical protein [Rhodovulum marinum]TCP41261.1 hypothetical protein EV662_1055 [Rhodovulum marinum]
MTSARKLAANRANASRSTGPRSAAGKARSAGNARRHGVFAREALAARKAVIIRTALEPEHAGPLMAIDPALRDELALALARLEIVRAAEARAEHALDAGIASAVHEDKDEEEDALGAALEETRRLSRYRAEASSSLHRALRRLVSMREDS